MLLFRYDIWFRLVGFRHFQRARLCLRINIPTPHVVQYQTRTFLFSGNLYIFTVFDIHVGVVARNGLMDGLDPFPQPPPLYSTHTAWFSVTGTRISPFSRLFSISPVNRICGVIISTFCLTCGSVSRMTTISFTAASIGHATSISCLAAASRVSVTCSFTTMVSISNCSDESSVLIWATTWVFPIR